MPPEKNAVTRARQGFEAWMGEPPAHALELTPPGAKEPSMSVLFFVDEADEDDEEDEPLAYLATAGLSQLKLPWSEGGAELLLCVKGDFDLDELVPLGKALGSLAAQLLSHAEAIAPGAMLEVGGLPVFEEMTHLLLTQWSDEEQSTLPDTSPAVKLLSVNPLFEDEAMAMQGLSEAEALAWIDEQGVDIDDPYRTSAVDPEMSEAMGLGQGLQGLQGMDLGGLSPEQAMAALTGEGSQLELAQAMQRMAGDMQSLLQSQLPGFLEQMQAQVAAQGQGGAPPDMNAMMAELQKIIAMGESGTGDHGSIDAEGEDVSEEPEPPKPAPKKK